ncbi:MAG: hypothetical protein LBI06_05780 [Treponema sp.]|jgi:hypothetical protein|nr:hypothetical protein [Treponema sp.]
MKIKRIIRYQIGGGAVELNEKLKTEIADIFRNVQYGRIIFYLNPESKILDYTVETKGRLPIAPQQISQKKTLKKTLDKTSIRA